MASAARGLTLRALPSCAGDAEVAALILHDVAASLAVGAEAGFVHGGLRPELVELWDDEIHVLPPTDPARLAATGRALLAPERSPGPATPAADVWSAAQIALERFLGGATFPPVANLAALRASRRTAVPRFGTLPAPFRAIFTAALAREPYLRPSAAQVVAAVEAAFASVGPDADAIARARLARLGTVATAFVDRRTAPRWATSSVEPVHIPLAARLAMRSPGTRVAAVGGVFVAAALLVVAAVGVTDGGRPVAAPAPNFTSAPSATATAPTPAGSAPPVAVAATPTPPTTTAVAPVGVPAPVVQTHRPTPAATARSLSAPPVAASQQPDPASTTPDAPVEAGTTASTTPTPTDTPTTDDPASPGTSSSPPVDPS